MARPEDVLQKVVCQYLDRALPAEAWYCAIPNGAVLAGNPRQRGMQMNKLKATGLKVGAPDLMIFHDGCFYAIELKAGDGKQNANQIAVAERIRTAGGEYYVCRSLEDVEAVVLFIWYPAGEGGAAALRARGIV